jgi:hypothetical protein
MSRNSRILVWVAGSAGTLLALLIILVLLLPFLIDTNIVRERIMAEVNRRSDIRVETRNLSLSYLPRPHATMHQAEIHIPGTARIQASSITAYPSLSALLQGKARIDKIEAEAPVISAEIPQAEKREEPKALTPKMMHQHVGSLLNFMAEKVTGLTAIVKRGDIHLFVENEPAIDFRNLEGEIRFLPNRFLVNFSGSSNLGELFEIDGEIDSENLIQGHIRVTGFELKRAAETFNISLPQELEKSVLKVDLTVESKNQEVLQVTVHQLSLTREPDNQLFPSALIMQGELIWEKTYVLMSQAQGSIGTSSFSELNGRISLEEPRILQIDSLSAGVKLHELYPWLLSFEQIENRLKDVRSLEGTLFVDEFTLNGPLREPGRWVFRGEGAAENVKLESPRLPAVLVTDISRIIMEETYLLMSQAQGSIGTSSFSGLNGRISLEETRIVQIESLSARLMLHELYPWLLSFEQIENRLKDVGSLEGTLFVDEFTLNGPLREPKRWVFKGEGVAENLELESPRLPAVLSTEGGRISASREKVSITNWMINIMDAALMTSGSIESFLERPLKIDADLAGDMGSQSVQWVAERIKLPEEIKTDSALSWNTASLFWHEGTQTRFSGNFLIEEGPEIVIDLHSIEGALIIKQLHVVDEDSDFITSFQLKKNHLDLTFEGNLNPATLDRILEENIYLEGKIAGDLQADILIDQPSQSTAYGILEIEGFSIPNLPVQLEQAVLRAMGNQVDIESSRFLWSEQNRASLTGSIQFSDEAFQINMDLVTNGINWEDIQAFTANRENEETAFFDIPIRGVIRARADYFRYNKYSWEPVLIRISFLEEGIEIDVDEAKVCGIHTRGTINLTAQGANLGSRVFAYEQPLSDTLECMWNRGDLMIGDFYLAGQISSVAEGNKLLDSLRGKIEFSSENGRIFRANLLARIFAAINITDILRGRAPDLVGEGLGFDNLIAEATIEGSSLILEQFILRGPSVNLFSVGNLNFRENTVDLTVTVSPFRTIDAVIDRIPVVGHILGGTLISLPVRVTGTIDNPFVNPISPTAVGEQLIGIMERTLTLPFRLIEPFFPNENK